MIVYEMGVFIRLIRIFCMLYNKSHILILLLYFEILFLGGYMILKRILVSVLGQEGALITYLIIGVVEGVMGLGLLIYLLRVAGKDYYLMLNING